MKEELTLQRVPGRRAMCPAPAFRERAGHLTRQIRSMLPPIKPVLPQLKKEAAGKPSPAEQEAELSERHPGQEYPETAFRKMSRRRERRTGTAKRKKRKTRPERRKMKTRPERKKK